MGPKTNNELYRIEKLSKIIETNNLTLINQIKREKIIRLHRNMGHASPNKLRQILCETFIMGLHPRDVQLFQQCEACGLGKPRRYTHKTRNPKENMTFGSHLHCDNTAKQPVQTKGGKT